MTTILIIKIIILLVLAVLVIITEKFYHKILFDLSLNLIHELQKNTPKIIIEYFYIVGLSCERIFIIFLLVGIFNICNFKLMVFLTNLIFTAFFVTNLTKMSYKTPRPYMVTNTITPLNCSTDFGNPSNNATYAFSFYISIFQLFYSYLNLRNFFFKFIYWVAISILLFSIAFSNLINGLEALNEIIFGSLNGLLLYYTYYYVLQIHQLKAKEFFLQFQSEKWFSTIIIFNYSICVIESCLVYIYSQDQMYKYRVNIACKNIPEYLKSYNYNFGTCLSYSGCISMILGILFVMKQFNLRQSITNFDKYEVINNWNRTSFYKLIIRLLISFSFIILMMLPFYLSIIDRINTKIILALFFGLESLVIFFCIFGFLIPLFVKIGLANEQITELDEIIECEEDKENLLDTYKL